MKLIEVSWEEYPNGNSKMSRRLYGSKLCLAGKVDHSFSYPHSQLQTPATTKGMTDVGRELVARLDGGGILGGAIRSSYDLMVEIHYRFDWDEDRLHERVKDAFRMASRHAFPGQQVELVFIGPGGVVETQFDEPGMVTIAQALSVVVDEAETAEDDDARMPVAGSDG